MACVGSPFNVSPKPPERYEVLATATGRACGSMLLLDPAVYFIPIRLNSRVARAYNRALSAVPEATSLINTTLSETWFWWVIGTARCTTITGEAIR
jgi:hypothetical protein